MDFSRVKQVDFIPVTEEPYIVSADEDQPKIEVEQENSI